MFTSADGVAKLNAKSSHSHSKWRASPTRVVHLTTDSTRSTGSAPMKPVPSMELHLGDPGFRRGSPNASCSTLSLLWRTTGNNHHTVSRSPSRMTRSTDANRVVVSTKCFVHGFQILGAHVSYDDSVCYLAVGRWFGTRTYFFAVFHTFDE